MTVSLLPENAIEVIRGESKTLQLVVTQKDPSGERATIPVDLTGAVVYFTVKARLEDPTNLIFKTSATVTDIEVTNARAGVANIYVHPADTQNLDIKDYKFDVWVRYTVTDKRFPVIPPSILRISRAVTVIPL